METVLIIVGGFITVGVAINAFFLKGIYSELNDVKLQMVKVISSSDFLKSDLLELEKDHRKLSDVVNSLILQIERLKS
jgi:sensor histidine kinase YesM